MIDSVKFKEVVVNRLNELKSERDNCQKGTSRYKNITSLMIINCNIYNHISFSAFGDTGDYKFETMMVQ